ncbi:MAG TPA: hypothetical protein VIL26_06295 [Clostridia bacterium]
MEVILLDKIGNFYLYYDFQAEKKFLLVMKDYDYRLYFKKELEARRYAHKQYINYLNWLCR